MPQPFTLPSPSFDCFPRCSLPLLADTAKRALTKKRQKENIHNFVRYLAVCHEVIAEKLGGACLLIWNLLEPSLVFYYDYFFALL